MGLLRASIERRVCVAAPFAAHYMSRFGVSLGLAHRAGFQGFADRGGPERTHLPPSVRADPAGTGHSR